MSNPTDTPAGGGLVPQLVSTTNPFFAGSAFRELLSVPHLSSAMLQYLPLSTQLGLRLLNSDVAWTIEQRVAEELAECISATYPPTNDFRGLQQLDMIRVIRAQGLIQRGINDPRRFSRYFRATLRCRGDSVLSESLTGETQRRIREALELQNDAGNGHGTRLLLWKRWCPVYEAVFATTANACDSLPQSLPAAAADPEREERLACLSKYAIQLCKRFGVFSGCHRPETLGYPLTGANTSSDFLTAVVNSLDVHCKSYDWTAIVSWAPDEEETVSFPSIADVDDEAAATTLSTRNAQGSRRASSQRVIPGKTFGSYLRNLSVAHLVHFPGSVLDIGSVPDLRELVVLNAPALRELNMTSCSLEVVVVRSTSPEIFVAQHFCHLAPTLQHVELPAGIVEFGTEAFVSAGTALTSPARLELDFSHMTGLRKVGAYFGKGSTIASLKLPSSVSEIGTEFLAGNEKIAELRLAHLTTPVTIGSAFLSGCRGLQTLTLPAQNVQVGQRFCCRCPRLSSSAVEALPGVAFEQQDALSFVNGSENGVYNNHHWGNDTAPERYHTVWSGYFPAGVLLDLDLSSHVGVTHLPDGFCQQHETLRTVRVPPSIQVIGSCSFADCRQLVSLEMASATQLHLIKDTVCKGTSLTELLLPSNVKQIGTNFAGHCRSLKRASLPPSLKRLGANCFDSCTALEELQWFSEEQRSHGEGLITVLPDGFCRLTAIKNLDFLPPTIEEIGANVFAECDSLETAHLASTSLREVSMHFLSKCPKLGTATFPSTLECIPEGFLNGAKALRQLDLSHTHIGRIDSKVFSNCSSLGSLLLDGPHVAVQTVKPLFANGCSALAEVTLPASLVEVKTFFLQGAESLPALDLRHTKLHDIGPCFCLGCGKLDALTLQLPQTRADEVAKKVSTPRSTAGDSVDSSVGISSSGASEILEEEEEEEEHSALASTCAGAEEEEEDSLLGRLHTALSGGLFEVEFNE